MHNCSSFFPPDIVKNTAQNFKQSSTRDSDGMCAKIGGGCWTDGMYWTDVRLLTKIKCRLSSFCVSQGLSHRLCLPQHKCWAMSFSTPRINRRKQCRNCRPDDQINAKISGRGGKEPELPERCAFLWRREHEVILRTLRRAGLGGCVGCKGNDKRARKKEAWHLLSGTLQI